MNSTSETTDPHLSASKVLPSVEPPADQGSADPVRPIPLKLRVLMIVGPVLALEVATLGPAGMAALLPPMENETPPGIVAAVVAILSVVVCLVAITLTALLLRCHGLRLRDAGFRWTRVSLPSLVAGLGIGAAVLLVVGLPLSRLGLLRSDDGWGLPWWALVIAGLFQAFALQGLPEELLFRGYQMTVLRLRPVASVFLSATVFCSLHLVSNGGQENALEHLYYLALPFGFAISAGALMILTDSLWASVGVHSGVHVGFLAGTFLGIGNGPALWLLCGAAWTVVGVVLLLVAWRRGRLTGLWRGPQR